MMGSPHSSWDLHIHISHFTFNIVNCLVVKKIQISIKSSISNNNIYYIQSILLKRD